MNKKPVVLMDANLLYWMVEEIVDAQPRKFDLQTEIKAFDELLILRKKHEVEVVIFRGHVISLKEAKKNRPDLRKIIGEHFDSKISIKNFSVLENGDLDYYLKRLHQLASEGIEKQDDPELFVLSHFTTPPITHVASCDMGLPAKFIRYREILKNDPSIRDDQYYKKMNTNIFCGLPSEVLSDIQSGDDN